jgi:enamine deaminase RidA (YjgF/YER057c/UK114 family)
MTNKRFVQDALVGAALQFAHKLRSRTRGADMTPEAKLQSMGLELPRLASPAANYVPFKISGNMLYLSGQGPRDPSGAVLTGKVGLGLLAAAKAAAGDLSRIEVVKVLGMVNAGPEFTEQPKVINGCSDLFVAVLGERGRHARSAVGMASLPMNITVEIEAVMRIHD